MARLKTSPILEVGSANIAVFARPGKAVDCPVPIHAECAEFISAFHVGSRDRGRRSDPGLAANGDAPERCGRLDAALWPGAERRVLRAARSSSARLIGRGPGSAARR